MQLSTALCLFIPFCAANSMFIPLCAGASRPPIKQPHTGPTNATQQLIRQMARFWIGWCPQLFLRLNTASRLMGVYLAACRIYREAVTGLSPEFQLWVIHRTVTPCRGERLPRSHKSKHPKSPAHFRFPNSISHPSRVTVTDVNPGLKTG
jgi:hypothetical protein